MIARCTSYITENEIDLLITDINMPEMSGVELTKIIKKNHPEIKVLVLTMYNDYQIIYEILMAEAEGYILKNIERDELKTAINRIVDNGTYYSNEVLSVMMKGTVKEKKTQNMIKDLSSRELEILKLIYDENTSTQIAENLNISKLTVETHRKNIIAKTNIRTTIGLIKFVAEHNIFSS